MNYWKDKKSMKEKAKEHYYKMNAFFANEIDLSVNNTKEYRYGVDVEFEDGLSSMSISLVDLDSATAAWEYKEGKTAILNFASYLNAGGCFKEGSTAQEESLCHVSTLYNVLLQKPEYYKRNAEEKNRGMYSNAALYSPDVVFINNNIINKFDVITCAAPNLLPAIKYGLNITKEENTEYLKSRINFILSIAERNKVDTLILGAWGCGVFKQDASEVAELFKEALISESWRFKKVIFAIPAGINFNKFDEVFTN